MVVPLSLACNESAQYQACRARIASAPGHWRFAFFDREPHALFGEDVKTRNVIVLWQRDHAADVVAVLPPNPRKCRTFPRERRHSRKNRYAWLGDMDSNQD
jgi:hypothetical protein